MRSEELPLAQSQGILINYLSYFTGGLSSHARKLNPDPLQRAYSISQLTSYLLNLLMFLVALAGADPSCVSVIECLVLIPAVACMLFLKEHFHITPALVACQ